jgi:uncharacterized small protein (DUF1192 family)
MTTYYQPLFDYMSNQHGLHLLESDMCEIINIVKQMKNKERIAILESEISRLKVANRITNERLEAIESHLAEQHKGANFSKSNSSEIPNTCDPFKPEASECVANNGVSGEPITPDYTHLLPNGYEFCEQGEHEKFVKVELFGGVNEEPVGFITDYNIFVGKYLPIRKSSPDYSHLLPEGYEFCPEEDAEKWVKVEKLPDTKFEHFEIGTVLNNSEDRSGSYKHTHYRPIRPIQYKVTTHEIVDAVPDPYQPDWSKAPEGTVAHAWDANGKSFWYTIVIDKELTSFMIDIDRSNAPTLPSDLDWKQSLRVKPSK